MRHSVAVIIVVLLAVTTVSAATFEPVTDGQLTERAQLVVVGHVLDAASRVRADGVIVTDYRIAAEEVLKGRVGAIVTITEIGGSANGIRMIIPGSAEYAVGSRVVAFLKQRPDGTYFTAGMSLGHYRFKTQRDRTEVLVRNSDGIDTSDETAFTPRRADVFLKYVRDHARGGARTAPETMLTIAADAKFEPVTNASAIDFVLTGGSPARPIRWKNCESGCTINYKVNNTQPGPSDVPGGIEDAMAVWTNDANSFVNLQLTGLSAVTNVAVFDTENTIVLDNPTSSSPNVGQCDGSLGCGIVWANDGSCGANCHNFDGSEFYTAIAGDAIIRPNTLNQIFFEALVAHELGHTMALKHGPSGNLMSASIPAGATASLKAWDKEAMAEVYGNGLPCQGVAITSQTSSGTVTSGNTKTLNVSVSGTSPFTYQWYEGSQGTITNPVGTNSSFTTPAITQPRSYWVKVTNACGSAESQTITISPTTPQCTAPAITVQPGSQTIAPGATATLTVEATGTAPLSYQWYQGSLGDTSNPVSTLKTFTTTPLNATTSYWVRVTNSCPSGTANSGLAIITVSQQCVHPSITSQPGNTTIALGTGITLAVTATGSAPLAYQWFRGESLDASQPIAGETSSSYAAPAFTTAGTFKFWVRVTNGCGTANSATISVLVDCPPLFVPLISAPPVSPATSGYDISWTVNPGPIVSAYELQEATNSDFTQNLKTFVVSGSTAKHIDPHSEITTDTRFFYRVLGTNACNQVKTAYSNTTSTLVTAPAPSNSSEFSVSVPNGVKQGFLQNYLVPGFGATATNSDTFSITTDVPWLTVFPASGALSAGGTTVQLTYNTTTLDIGTTTATVTVNRVNGTAAGNVSTNGSVPPLSLPFGVSIVTPVSPVPRDTTPPPGTLIIPAIAHADGVGTRFQSDVRIANTSTQPITYQLSFTPSGTNGTQVGKQTTITIAARDSKGLDDIVKAWYGSGVLGESGVGTLEIRPLNGASPLATFASSRTYAISNAGTLGQFIPAIPLESFIANVNENPLAKLSLQQIANSADYRTNVGFVEGSGQGASMLVKLLDGNNNLLQSVTRTLSPYEHQQLRLVDVFPNAPQVSDARMEVSVTSPAGKVTAYASVVDNKTSDPLLIFPVQAAATKAQHYVVPGIAELNNGASNFHSDMRVFNGGTTPVAVSLRYYPQGSSTPNDTVVPRTIQPGQVLALDNVLPTLWGLTASGGAVTVDAPSDASLVVTARTYSRNAAGTFGQFIPGVTAREAVGLGERSLELLQLEESPQYRTNLGLVEVTGKGVNLEISAYKPDTKLTTVVPFHLNANQFVQLGFAFKFNFGMPTVYQGRISVKVVGGEGRVAAYGSVVDNRTVDPTYVPAQ